MFTKINEAFKQLFGATSQGEANPEKEIEAYNVAIQETQKEIEGQLSEKDARIKELETEVSELKKDKEAADKAVTEIQSTVSDLNSQVEAKDKVIEEKSEQITGLENEASELKEANIALAAKTKTEPIETGTETAVEEITGEKELTALEKWQRRQAKNTPVPSEN